MRNPTVFVPLRREALVLLLLVVSAALLISPVSEAKKGEFPEIEWIDLIPEDDLEALMNPPDYLAEIEDGSPEDTLSSEVAKAIAQSNDDRYQQALVSQKVRPEFADKQVKIPGFVVPLAFDDQMVVTEFFLVPYFGACIHTPPPPPNQIIYVAYADGLRLESLYDPFYIEGTIKLENHSTGDMGTSAYSIEVSKIYPY
jgi:hypothetical protein